MEKIIIWILISYGVTNIIVYGSIFQWLRDIVLGLKNSQYGLISSIGKFFNEMLSCMMCSGFHIGWILSLIIFSPLHHFFGVDIYTSLFFDASLSSGSVWIINSIVEWFEENRVSYTNIDNSDSREII